VPKGREFADKKVVSVTCSPAAKNDRCNMVIFYTDDLVAQTTQFFTDFDDKVDQDEQEGEVLIEPMNKRFAPHEFVSFTIYEEDHPNTEDGLSTSITHVSPPNDQDLDPSMPKTMIERF
jgi:hypothetical protein